MLSREVPRNSYKSIWLTSCILASSVTIKELRLGYRVSLRTSISAEKVFSDERIRELLSCVIDRLFA